MTKYHMENMNFNCTLVGNLIYGTILSEIGMFINAYSYTVHNQKTLFLGLL